MKKSLLTFVILLIALAGAYAWYKKSLEWGPDNSEQKTEIPITIASVEINEENYTGSRPVIEGSGVLAETVRAYVEGVIAEFATQADLDVPQMRADFGVDAPAASYSIEMAAAQVESKNTKSIIVSEYVYTGGAHGNSAYKTFTVSKKDGEVIALGDIVKIDEQESFTALVKEKLLAWRPELSDGAPVVFEEDVAALTFDSFQNWSLDDENLTLYFSQYEVGPGVLGAFAFPIPFSELGLSE